MNRLPPRATPTDPLVPSPTLCRSDAHFVFDRAATHRIGGTDAAITPNLALGHNEGGYALAAGWGIGQPCQYQMHDVVGEVVLAGGDEYLGAGDGVTAVGLWLGAGFQQAQVGTAMRLGQAHGAGPAAVDDGAQEHLFLPVFTMMLQRFGGAVREQRVVAPGQVGGVDHLLERYPERFGQDRKSTRLNSSH